MTEVVESSSKQTQARVAWVDVLKFLGMVAIYLGHVTQTSQSMISYVFAYHVPLFFMVSGFFAKNPHSLKKPSKHICKQNLLYIYKKFRSLIVPYFVFSVITNIVLVLWEGYDQSTAIKYFGELLMGRRNHIIAYPLWFFSCLFVVTIVHYGLSLVLRNKWIILALALLLNLYHSEILSFFHIEPLSLFFNIDSALAYLAYYSLGQCLYSLLKRIAEHRLKWLWATILLLIFGFVAVNVYYSGTGWMYTIMAKVPLLSLFTRCAYLIQVIALILFQYALSLFLSEVKVFVNLGRHTLVLCGAEMITKTLISSIGTMMGWNLYAALVNPFSAIVYAGFCCGVSYYLFVVQMKEHYPRIARIISGG